MDDTHSYGDPAELAALYAAGGMEAEQAAEFEAHLEGGCPQCAAELCKLDCVVEELLAAVPPLEADPSCREQLMNRIQDEAGFRDQRGAADPQVWKRWDSEDLASELVIKQAFSGQWQSSGIEGVEFRRLFVDHDRNQMSALVRMAPGTAYPGHLHNGAEECLVLEGDLRTGDHHLQKGDYQRMPAGSHHGVQSTENGCLLFIVSSLSDELK